MDENISIVMVSYHTGDVFYKAIEAALAQDKLKELIIVDNGNPDEVRARIRQWSDEDNKLKYYTGHGNVGFASGCNIGAKRAKGDTILFLNPDCILPSGAIAKACEEMKAHKDAWLAGICMMGPEGRREANNKRNILSPQVALSEVFKLCKYDVEKFPRINIEDTDDNEQTEYVPAISGAFMMIRLDRYNEMGGMDNKYFFHVEDLDFCKEIEIQGGKVLYIPSIKAVHHRSSSDVSSFFVEWHKTKGFVRYFKKHYSSYYAGLFLILIWSAIWTRFLTRIPKIIFRQAIRKSQQKETEQRLAQ